MNNDQQINVIVLNWNGYEDTKTCINSLDACNYYNLQIIIVDNASEDNSVELLRQNFPDKHLIVSDVNGGYAHGMNLGIKYALKSGADSIIILNNDTIVDNNFLINIVNTAYLDEKIGIVSPKVGYLGKEDTLYCGGGNFSLLKCGGIAMYQGKKFNKFATEDREINFAEGCCLLVKREVFEKVGLFEEKFFMYFEDVEFSNRVNKFFKIMFCSDAIIYHKSGAGKRLVDYSQLYYFYYTRNRFWVFSDQNLFNKIYVVLFSLLNVIHKYLVLKIALINSTNGKNIRLKKSIESLFKGFREGIKLLLLNKSA